MASFEEAFEQTGYGKFNHIVLVTSGLVLLYTTIESLGIGYIIDVAECDLFLTPREKGMVNAAAFIGIFVMAIVWGYLSDRCGRRRVMLPSLIASSVVSFSSSFSQSFWIMFLTRFLTGCLVSASSATVYAYLGEMHSNAKRSSVIAFASTFISFTFIVLPILAWIIIPATWSTYLGSLAIVPWRVFVWSWCLPGLVAAVLLLFLPESPRYLYSAKGQDHALPVLAKIYSWNTGRKTDEYPVAAITKMTSAMAQHGFANAFKNVKLLMRPPLVRCVLISHFSMFMIFMTSSSLYTWMPGIINKMLDNMDKPLSMCDVMTITGGQQNQTHEVCQKKPISPFLYPILMIMGTICCTTYLGIGFIMNRHKKIPIYSIVLVVCALMLTASSVIPNPIVGIAFFVLGLSSGCAASVLSAIAVEVFPTCVRALALCTLYMAGRSGAAAGAQLLGLCLYNHCIAVMFSTTLLTAGSTILLIFWPNPEDVREVMQGKGFAY